MTIKLCTETFGMQEPDTLKTYIDNQIQGLNIKNSAFSNFLTAL